MLKRAERPGLASVSTLRTRALPAMVAAVWATSGCSGFAGAAPVGPEVDEDGDVCLGDDLVEECGVGGDGFGLGWERVLAGSAATGVGEVRGGDPVLLGAVFAGFDEGHRGCLPCGSDSDYGYIAATDR